MGDKRISYDAYQQMAEYYADDVNQNVYNAMYERPAIISMIPEVAGMSILDAGCGAGFLSNWLLKNDAARITGIDFSENMISYSKQLCGEERCEFLVWDLNEKLDFAKDETFDLIVSSLTIHYLMDLTAAMKEFFRVLKPCGSVIFSTHHPTMTYLGHDLKDYFEKQLLIGHWNKNGVVYDVSFFHRSLHEIIKPLFEAGFLIEMLQEPMPLPSVKKVDPRSYEKLSKEPRFLFIKAKKIEI